VLQKQRNNMIFNNKAILIDELVDMMNLFFFFFLVDGEKYNFFFFLWLMAKHIIFAFSCHCWWLNLLACLDIAM